MAMPALRKTEECKTHHVIISSRDTYTSMLIPAGGELVQICRDRVALFALDFPKLVLQRQLPLIVAVLI